MREPPELPNETIIASVHASYGIPVAALMFLPIGKVPDRTTVPSAHERALVLLSKKLSDKPSASVVSVLRLAPFVLNPGSEQIRERYR